MSVEKKGIYKCDVCGNIVESLWNGKPSVDCCGKPMVKLVANTVDAAVEKHVPVVTKNGNVVTVKVGSVAHPMDPDHFILFIEVVAGNMVYRRDLVEGDKVAEATFIIDGEITEVREFCNKHGLWSAKL